MIASYFHRGGDTPLLGGTIGAHCAAIATRCAEREAVVEQLRAGRSAPREHG